MGRRLVQFYAKGGRARKTKMEVTERNTMPAPMPPAPGAPVSMSADGPAMKKGGKTALKRGGKLKVTIKEKNLARGGNPMSGRMTTGVVGRKPRMGMPVAGGGGPSLTSGGGAEMRQPSMQTVPSMMGALGRVR